MIFELLELLFSNYKNTDKIEFIESVLDSEELQTKYLEECINYVKSQSEYVAQLVTSILQDIELQEAEKVGKQ